MLELHDLYARHPRIPQRIIFQFSTHVAIIASVNAEICQARETRGGQPGRDEWEYRRAHAHRAERSARWLAHFDALASARGVSAEALGALYADMGGKPAILPMSREAADWGGIAS